MPDHLHLLVQGAKEDSHLPTFCTLLRQRLAHAYASYAVLVCGNQAISRGFCEKRKRWIEEYPFSGGTWYEELLADTRPS